MKKIITLLTSISLMIGASAQVVTDTVSVNSGYVNENYYTLNNENKVPITRSDWDLAFASDGVGFGSSAIRINGGMGTELYKYSNDTMDWSTLDTTGFNWSLNRLISADTSWSVGAFSNTTPQSGFDLGWGTYSTVTHIVSGDRIFILKLSNGDYKKIVIDKLQSGTYNFRYADLNGNNFVNTSISKSNYPGKNFGYYSIQNNTALDREPASTSWDLLFTKYVTDLGGGTYYGVTGVLTNVNVKVAQAYPVNDPYTEPYTGQNYGFIINTIGHDWKSFNTTTFQYEIEDSLVYFVEDANQDVYRMVFTGFGGSANGNFIFDKELVGNTTGINDDFNKTEIFDIYPNPATSFVNVTFTSDDNSTLSLHDITGKIVYTKTIVNSGLNQERIDASNLTKGMYFLSIISSNEKSTQKIIIK